MISFCWPLIGGDGSDGDGREVAVVPLSGRCAQVLAPFQPRCLVTGTPRRVEFFKTVLLVGAFTIRVLAKPANPAAVLDSVARATKPVATVRSRFCPAAQS